MGGAFSGLASSRKITQTREQPENSSHGPHQHTCPVSPEITRTIFRYLDTNERLRMAQVCPAWAAIADETWMWPDDEVRLCLSTKNVPSLKKLHQHGIFMVKVEEIQDPFKTLPQLLQTLPGMKSLNLSHCISIGDESVRRAFSARLCTSLTVLNLSWCSRIGDIAVDCFTSALPNLEELYINGCWRIKNSSMALVASRLRKLKLIEMDKCRVGNTGLWHLSGFSITKKPFDGKALPQLQHISIRSSPYVTHAGLLLIRQKMQHLATLNIAMCESLQDRAVIEIAGMKHLKHLDLHGCKKLTARSIAYLATGLLSLTYLDVSYCPYMGDDAMEKVFNGPGLLALTTLKMESTSITDYGLTIVALNMECLTSLNVSNCQAISMRGIEAVSVHLENLRYFYVRFCKRLHNDALVHLSRMANLQVLSLKGCRGIGSQGMETLASGQAAANLLELDVGFTSVDDIGVKYIAKAAKKLRVLGLAGCPVSDDGIALISRDLPSLHTLKLSRCHRVTEGGIDAAAGNHKNLTQISVKGCPNVTEAWKDRMVAKRRHN